MPAVPCVNVNTDCFAWTPNIGWVLLKAYVALRVPNSGTEEVPPAVRDTHFGGTLVGTIAFPQPV